MSTITFECVDEGATHQLAETIALALKTGDLITLEGDLGAGKTTLARALIRAACGDDQLEVPSPTFTLVQSYSGTPYGKLAHMDLYRLEDPRELEELGLEDALQDGVVLVEWPQKGHGELPSPAFNIKISEGPTDDSRIFSFSGREEALQRLARSLAIRDFLDKYGHGDSRRQHLTGDASARAYETITPVRGDPVILMNSPEAADGPPIKNGKPYSEIARLAENIRAFVGVAHALEKQGFATPEIIAHDLNAGFLLIENLGHDTIIDGQRVPIEERYRACVEALAAIHAKQWSAVCPLPEGEPHVIVDFDKEALLIEVDLLPQWYAKFRLGRLLNRQEKAEFNHIWGQLIDRLDDAERSIVLRDFHSPNVIWRGDKTGVDRIGLIDFQDAVMGPCAYDLASLAQDARVDVSAELENSLFDYYCQLRPGIDAESLRKAYAIMAAQRATKILGIFVRLCERDGKEAYLAHLPRIEGYLIRSLQHPALAVYRAWMANTFLDDNPAIPAEAH